MLKQYPGGLVKPPECCFYHLCISTILVGAICSFRFSV